VHRPHHILPADGALVHPLAALGAGDHVTAFQKNAVYHGIHADPAQVLIHAAQLSYLRTICKTSQYMDGLRSGLIIYRSCVPMCNKVLLNQKLLGGGFVHTVAALTMKF